MTHILDNIYLGNYNDSLNLDMLKRLGIRTVISAMDTRKPPVVLAAYSRMGIKHYHIKVDDHPSVDIMRYAQLVIDIVNTGQPILVHCLMGMSRSATLVLAAVISKTGMGITDAIKYVRARRPIIQPNPGFMKQLQLWNIQRREQLKK